MAGSRQNVEKILEFAERNQVYGNKNKLSAGLDDEKWLTELAFLVDMTAHLNY